MSLSGVEPETKDAATSLLESVGAALERQLGTGVSIHVLGFVDSAAPMTMKSVDSTALYINSLIATPDSASVDAVTYLTDSSAVLQEDLQGQGTSSLSPSPLA